MRNIVILLTKASRRIFMHNSE